MINPSEVSEILKKELSAVNAKVSFEEVGTVLSVGDGVAHVYGLENVKANELVEFENGVTGVAMNLEESNVGVILLDKVNEVTENMSVRRTGKIASIEVGEGLLGRVINMLGEPLDGKGPIEGKMVRLPLDRKAPGVIFRQPVNQPLQTGIKAIDSMIPIGRGQRELIIGDRQIGKTAIAIDTIINQKSGYDAGKPVSKVAVCGGSGGSMIADVLRHGCDTYVTADVKYDQFLTAKECGLNIIDGDHFCTENVVIPVLENMIKTRFSELEVFVSMKHKQTAQFF